MGSTEKNISFTASVEKDHFANELIAAEKNLGATATELSMLIEPILLRIRTRDQISELLAKSWTNVCKLRSLLAKFYETINLDSPLKSLIKKLVDQTSIENGKFSLENKERLMSYFPENQKDGQLTDFLEPSILEIKALIALIYQEYRIAAENYAEIQKNQGLTVELKWYFQNEHALVLCDLGREFLDNNALEEAIELFKSSILDLLSESDNPKEWSVAQTNLGIALGVLGQRKNGTRILENSIESFQKALSVQENIGMNYEWARTQNSLGNTLGILAQRLNDTEMLEASLAAFEKALLVRTVNDFPGDWASTQNNLGSVLLALGQRKKDAQILKKSVEAYKKIMTVWTREKIPLHWATTFNNLGTALRHLGEYRKGPRTLEQAVAAYRNALAERTRDRVPDQWAMTQNNLGSALHKLGERSEDVKPFQDAIVAYQSALEEWTRDSIPITWAMTTANLAIAQKGLAERLGDPGTAGLALAGFQAAGEVFRSASHAQYYEFATEQVAKTRQLISEIQEAAG
tara:strand:- start:372 stop:1931 length:1560 start_codon:yes stop_codon:yes gene_type:complete